MSIHHPSEDHSEIQPDDSPQEEPLLSRRQLLSGAIASGIAASAAAVFSQEGRDKESDAEGEPHPHCRFSNISVFNARAEQRLIDFSLEFDSREELKAATVFLQNEERQIKLMRWGINNEEPVASFRLVAPKGKWLSRQNGLYDLVVKTPSGTGVVGKMTLAIPQENPDEEEVHVQGVSLSQDGTVMVYTKLPQDLDIRSFRRPHLAIEDEEGQQIPLWPTLRPGEDVPTYLSYMTEESISEGVHFVKLLPQRLRTVDGIVLKEASLAQFVIPKNALSDE